jgi:hypothetical protein
MVKFCHSKSCEPANLRVVQQQKFPCWVLGDHNSWIYPCRSVRRRCNNRVTILVQ